MHSLLKIGFALVVAGCLLERSCYFEHRFPSPDGRSAAVLKGITHLADSLHGFVLEEGWFNTVELAPKQDDCALLFAHAAWTDDSSRVTFYSSDTFCPPVWIAYDLKRRVRLPPESLADTMRESLRKTYWITGVKQDPLEWMQTKDAATAFRLRTAR